MRKVARFHIGDMADREVGKSSDLPGAFKRKPDCKLACKVKERLFG
jgi:hypothetical protein